MPPNYVTIPKEDYQAILREVKRGIEVCAEVSALRLTLQTVSNRLETHVDKKILERVIESCDDVSRLRVELFALERRLREFDHELTPLRPRSSADIKAAFDNSVNFASGKKKPPPTGGE